jgi:hypothetical protein
MQGWVFGMQTWVETSNKLGLKCVEVQFNTFVWDARLGVWNVNLRLNFE